MRAYEHVRVRGWRKRGPVFERDMLVSEELSVSLDGPCFHAKTLRRLSNCLFVLVTTPSGAQKTITRLEGECWGKGSPESEADYLERSIFEIYAASKAAASSAV
jgi:hypothetical protein